jgi:hypothetical protein
MEIITRTFTTVQGEPASAWQVRLTNDDEVINAGQVTRTDAGYVVDRAGGRRYTYRTAARAAQAMREHIAEKWPDELSEQPAHDPETEAVAAAESVLELLADSHEISALVEMLADVQRRTEATGTWSTPAGRAVEYALGHLRLALEAPGMSKLSV